MEQPSEQNLLATASSNVFTTNTVETFDLKDPNFLHSSMIFMAFVYHSYVIHMFSYVIRMYSYVTSMSLVFTCMSSVCHSFILVCHPYVIYISLACTRMWLLSTGIVICMSLVCGFTLWCFTRITTVKNSTLKVYPNISEVQPAIKWLAHWITLYRKQVIWKLHSNNSTETATQRCSSQNYYSEKNLFCIAVALDLL